jgi:hypothetical protein
VLIEVGVRVCVHISECMHVYVSVYVLTVFLKKKNPDRANNRKGTKIREAKFSSSRSSGKGVCGLSGATIQFLGVLLCTRAANVRL